MSIAFARRSLATGDNVGRNKALRSYGRGQGLVADLATDWRCAV
jgi:hypothetical protein